MPDNSVINNDPQTEKIRIVYKCPEYILKAQRNHYHKKKQEDPDFLEKERERNRKYRDANREHVNELARIRRRNKKMEAQKQQELQTTNKTADKTTDVDVIKSLESLKV